MESQAKVACIVRRPLCTARASPEIVAQVEVSSLERDYTFLDSDVDVCSYVKSVLK